MGFGEISSASIMFIAVTLTSVILAGVFGSQIQEVSFSSVQKQRALSAHMTTDLHIQHVFYDADAQQVKAYVQNTGRTPLRPGEFTIYVENEYFRGNGPNSTAVMVAETDVINEGILDSKEIVLITINTTLASSQQYMYRILTPYSTKHSKIFTT